VDSRREVHPLSTSPDEDAELLEDLYDAIGHLKAAADHLGRAECNATAPWRLRISPIFEDLGHQLDDLTNLHTEAREVRRG
jgi:hypothetical protein